MFKTKGNIADILRQHTNSNLNRNMILNTPTEKILASGVYLMGHLIFFHILFTQLSKYYEKIRNKNKLTTLRRSTPLVPCRDMIYILQ